MTNNQKKAAAAWRKAIPASGFRPETPLEWNRLQRASILGAYYMYRDMGKTKAEAKKLAKLTHGGPAGRLILEAAFSDSSEVGGAS